MIHISHFDHNKVGFFLCINRENRSKWRNLALCAILSQILPFLMTLLGNFFHHTMIDLLAYQRSK